MQSEKIRPILNRLGFFTNNVSESWDALAFTYDSVNLLFIPDDDDNTLIFTAPNLFEVDDENRAFVHDILNELANTVKFIKPSILYGNSVYLSYEYYLADSEPTDEIVEHIIRLLGLSFYKFHDLVNRDGESVYDDDEDEELAALDDEDTDDHDDDTDNEMTDEEDPR